MKMRTRRPLTSAELSELSAAMKQAVQGLETCERILSETLTVAEMKPYERAFGRVQSLRSRLDSLACGQCPPGTDPTRLFFGPDWTYHANWR